MRWFLGQEQAYRVYSTDNEEKLGDGLETVLGFFDVISYFGEELPKWGNVCQYRPMLEATFLKFVRENMTSHMTGVNRKRNGTVKYMEAVCEGVHGFPCMTDTLPKGIHLEVMNVQSQDTSFPYWPYKGYTAFGSNIHHSDLFHTSKALVKILRRKIGAKRGNPIPCNGGGWVNIDHILDREDVFPQNRYNKSDRFQIIAECIRSEDRRAWIPRLELISTGKFVIHVDGNEPKTSDTTRVTEEAKQAQREAKKDAERIVTEEEQPDTNEMSEGRSADTIGHRDGYRR